MYITSDRQCSVAKQRTRTFIAPSDNGRADVRALFNYAMLLRLRRRWWPTIGEASAVNARGWKMPLRRNCVTQQFITDEHYNWNQYECQYNFRINLPSTSHKNLPRILIFFICRLLVCHHLRLWASQDTFTLPAETATVRWRWRLWASHGTFTLPTETATVRLRRHHQSNAVRYVHNLMNDEQIVNHNKPRPAHHYIISAKSTSMPGELTSTARSLTSVPDGLGSSQHLMIIIGINGLTCRDKSGASLQQHPVLMACARYRLQVNTADCGG